MDCFTDSDTFPVIQDSPGTKVSEKREAWAEIGRIAGISDFSRRKLMTCSSITFPDADALETQPQISRLG